MKVRKRDRQKDRISVSKTINPMDYVGILGIEDEEFNFKEKMMYYKSDQVNR